MLGETAAGQDYGRPRGSAAGYSPYQGSELKRADEDRQGIFPSASREIAQCNQELVMSADRLSALCQRVGLPVDPPAIGPRTDGEGAARDLARAIEHSREIVSYISRLVEAVQIIA